MQEQVLSLALTVPKYLSSVNYNSLITIITFFMFESIILVSLYVPIQFLAGAQETLLAGTSNCYLFMHILSYVPLFFLAVFGISLIGMVAVIVLARNEKLYNLFCGTGTAYILAYMVVILLNTTRLLIFLVLFVIAVVVLVIFKKVKRDMHNAVCKAVLTGHMVNVLISNLTPFDYMEDAHYDYTKLRYVNNMLVIATFLAAAAISLLWSCFHDKFVAKIKSLRK